MKPTPKPNRNDARYDLGKTCALCGCRLLNCFKVLSCQQCRSLQRKLSHDTPTSGANAERGAVSDATHKVSDSSVMEGARVAHKETCDKEPVDAHHVNKTPANATPGHKTASAEVRVKGQTTRR